MLRADHLLPIPSIFLSFLIYSESPEHAIVEL